MYNNSRLLISILHIGTRRTFPLRTFSVSPKKDILVKCSFKTDRGNLSFLQARMSSGDTKYVTYEEVSQLKNNNTVLLIDVREPVELKETGTIPGSINIPLQELENALKKLPRDQFRNKYHLEKPDLSTPLVFSCKAGIRSEKAMNVALSLGYSNVRNFKGGWMEWEQHLNKN